MPQQRVGSLYRARREELGIPIEVAADATNVRARLLEILESGDYGNYPPKGHAIGMLSSYARYLKLDPRPLIERFEEEYEAFQQSREIATSADNTRRGVGRFGERVSTSDKPLPREAKQGASGIRGHRRKRPAEDEAASRISEKLNNERVAEGDNRYVSGSVRVIGTRETGSFGRASDNRPRHAESPSPRSSSHADPGRPIASSGGTGRLRYRDQLRSQSTSGASSRSTGADSRRGRIPPHTASDRGERGGARTGSQLSSSYSRARRGDQQDRGSQRPAAGGDSLRNRSGHAHDRLASSGQGERAGKRDAEPEKETLSFYGGAALDKEDAVARRRPRTHRATGETMSTSDSEASKNALARVRDTLRGLFAERHTRNVIIAFAVIIIGVIVAASILVSTAGNSNSGNIPVEGGAQDTSSVSKGADSATTTVTTTNGNPVNVKIDVAQGNTSLISVTYDDDNAYSGTAVGPWSREFLVTSSLSATFGSLNGVTVTENGTKVDVEQKEDGSGELSLTIKTTTSSTQTSQASQDGQ